MPLHATERGPAPGGRRGLATTSLVEAVLLAVLVTLTGCIASPAATAPRAAPHSSGQTTGPMVTGSRPGVDLVLPPVAKGEVARVVAEGAPLQVDATSGTSAATGVEYVLEAACVAGAADTVVAYRLLLEGRSVSTGTIACDGERYRNTGLLGTGRPDGGVGGGAVQVLLDDLPPEVTRAFARLVPADG